MSPFKSLKQKKWMYANKPEMAAKWSSETPDMKSLPTRVKTKKKKMSPIKEYLKK